MIRIYFLSMLLFISTFLVRLDLLSAQEDGAISESNRIGKEIQAEKLQFRNLSKLQTVSSDSEGMETRKEGADSSKEKTFCFSFGGGSSQKKYERGGPKQIVGLSHVPLTFRLLEYPIAIMISTDYGSEFDALSYNMLYMIPLTKSKRTNIFIGSGIGSIEIDEKGSDDMDYAEQKHTIYNLEVGYKTGFWFLGPYAKVRHSFIKGTKTWRLFILGFDIDIFI